MNPLANANAKRPPPMNPIFIASLSATENMIIEYNGYANILSYLILFSLSFFMITKVVKRKGAHLKMIPGLFFTLYMCLYWE